MCLSNISERKIATEDIVCYKRVVKVIDGFLTKRYTGKCTVTINNTTMDAVLVHMDDSYVFLQNTYLGGMYNQTLELRKKHKMFYSWILDHHVSSVIVHGKEIYSKNGYFTYYRYSKVILGKTYKSRLVETENTIEEGLHSHAVKTEDSNVKCIIPKGAIYYTGVFGGTPGYASNKLKYIEIINEVK